MWNNAIRVIAPTVLAELLLLLGASAQAATVTHRVSTAVTTNASSYTSGSFTPLKGEELVVFVIVTGKACTSATPTVTDTQTLTWTQQATAAKNASADCTYLFTSSLTTAATAMTVTFATNSGNASGSIIFVASVAGMSKTGASAVVQTAKAENQAGGGTPAVTFGASVTSTNPTLGAVANAANPATLTPPSGWTERADAGYNTPATGGEYVTRDRGFSGTAITWGSSSASAFSVLAVELDAANNAGSNTPTKLEWTITPTLNSVAATKYQVKLNNPTAAGDTIVLFGTYGSGTDTITGITDDQTNTWTKDKTVADTGHGQSAVIARASNVASGTRVITVNFSVSENFMQFGAIALNNIATTTPLDVSCGQTTSGASTPCGAMTTTQAGDFIVAIGTEDSGTFPSAIAALTPDANFTGFATDGSSLFEGMFGTHSVAGAINPTLTWSFTSSSTIVAGVAYKTVASAGGSPGTGVYVQQTLIMNFSQPQILSGTSFTIDFPCPSGVGINLIDIGWQSNNTANLSSVSSSPANTWTTTTPTGNTQIQVGHAYAANATCSTAMRITLTLAATPSSTNAFTFAVWGISGAATSPLDVTCSATGSFAAPSGTLTNAPSCTTTGANELITAFENHNSETVTSASPGYDLEPDFGVYESFNNVQDGGIQHHYAATAGTYNISWTFSAYEGGSPNVGSWAAQAMAWKAPAGAGAAPSNLPLVGCCQSR